MCNHHYPTEAFSQCPYCEVVRYMNQQADELLHAADNLHRRGIKTLERAKKLQREFYRFTPKL